jgi:hypothetical protein
MTTPLDPVPYPVEDLEPYDPVDLEPADLMAVRRAARPP